MRSWVSTAVFYSAFLCVITGAVLYVLPYGRIAYWTDWRLLGLDKDRWEALHILSGLLMLVTATLHLYLNWRAFKNYLRPSSAFVGSTLLALGIVVVSATNLPPSSWLLELKTYLKNSWGEPEVPPPVPHAELLSLKAVLLKEGLPVEDTVRSLREQGLRIPNPEMTLKELARLNRTSPAKLYLKLLRLKESRPNTPPSVSRPGKRTLKEVCELLGLSERDCLGILSARGVSADLNETLREIYFREGVSPREIVNLLASEARRDYEENKASGRK